MELPFPLHTLDRLPHVEAYVPVYADSDLLVINMSDPLHPAVVKISSAFDAAYIVYSQQFHSSERSRFNQNFNEVTTGETERLIAVPAGCRVLYRLR